MPAWLSSALWFPPVQKASGEGLLALGGDLTPERLLLGYSRGIFPWYSGDMPIMWWSPNPRWVLPLEGVHVPRRLARRMRKGNLVCTLNRDFEAVIQHCARSPRPGQAGTWLVPDMQRAYVRLHHLGFAHSVECWEGERLVGGVYGVALGRAFFGESMFHRVSDASKVALLWLTELLRQCDFTLFDCQQETPHMVRLGACSIPRQEFGRRLEQALLPQEGKGLSLARYRLPRAVA